MSLPINLIAIDYLEVFKSKLELEFDENSFYVREFMSSVSPYKDESPTNTKFILRSLVSALKDKDIISQLLSKETLGYKNRSILLDEHYGIDLELLGPSSLTIFLNKCKDGNPRKTGIQILLDNGFSVEDILNTLKDGNDENSSLALAIFLDYCQKPTGTYPCEDGIQILLDNGFSGKEISDALTNNASSIRISRARRRRMQQELTVEDKTPCENVAKIFQSADESADHDSASTASVSSSGSSIESRRGR